MSPESQDLPIFEKDRQSSAMYHYQHEPEEYRSTYKFRDINGRVDTQRIQCIPKPFSKASCFGKTNRFETKAINGPKESLRSKPHLVEDQMGESTEGKDKHPSFLTVPIEVRSGKGNGEEEEKGVAKYPAIA